MSQSYYYVIQSFPYQDTNGKPFTYSIFCTPGADKDKGMRADPYNIPAEWSQVLELASAKYSAQQTSSAASTNSLTAKANNNFFQFAFPGNSLWLKFSSMEARTKFENWLQGYLCALFGQARVPGFSAVLFDSVNVTIVH